MEILRFDAHTKYLGRKLTFDDYHRSEVSNRISSAWRKFNLLRHELTSNAYPLKARLKLFDGTITPTVLYGCASWTLTKDLQTTLKRTQRRMLRIVLGTPRRQILQASQAAPSDHSTDDVNSNTSQRSTLEETVTLTEQDLLEPWPDFVKRATRLAETMSAEVKAEDWVTIFWKSKWRWAQRIAAQPCDRWSRLAATWDPEIHDKRPTARRSGGQHKRWDDDINAFLRDHQHAFPNIQHEGWLRLAHRQDLWGDMEDNFVKHMATTPSVTPTRGTL